ncbi:hypothetical protein [Streptomyces sp. NPDC088755]|uniref:hypothetical protein n=1 Tax=Streptomyces sp. NPDC088755 TaxID=3365888 RepID=UPI003803D428
MPAKPLGPGMQLLTTSSLETPLSTRSFIGRPNGPTFTGVYVHWDGYPSNQLPLLLAAFTYKFRRDLNAMTAHLVDDAPGWSFLGTDLLDDAPEAIRLELAPRGDDPSEPTGGPERQIVTTESTSGLAWGYVLRPAGIEVISLPYASQGPLVDWNVDPRAHFNNDPFIWSSLAETRGAPRITPAPPTPVAMPSTVPGSSPRAAARR